MIGCGIPKHVKESFTYCFDNKYSGLDALINLEGFYYAIGEADSNKNDPEKSQLEAYIFYTNGFATTKFAVGWLQSDIDDKYGFFGKYELIYDTIKVQFLSSPRDMLIGKHEVWFKIIDKNTLRMLYYGDGKNVKNSDLENFKLNPFYQKHGTKYVFYPLSKVPDISKTYIINRKWFWCDKEKYKQWKKNHKRN